MASLIFHDHGAGGEFKFELQQVVKLQSKAFDNLDIKKNSRNDLKMQHNQLKLSDRQVIEKLKNKMTKTEIAKILDCH